MICKRRPRTDKAHIADQDIEDLRQLIHRGLTHKAANLCDSGILVAIEGRTVCIAQIGRVHIHGAQLEHFEVLTVHAAAGSVIEHGATVLQINERSHDNDNQQHKRQGDQADQNIQRSFSEFLIHIKYIPSKS